MASNDMGFEEEGMCNSSGIMSGNMEAINDMEHPDLVNSTLEDDDDVDLASSSSMVHLNQRRNGTRIVHNMEQISFPQSPTSFLETLTSRHRHPERGGNNILSSLGSESHLLKLEELITRHRIKILNHLSNEEDKFVQGIKEDEEKQERIVALKESTKKLEDLKKNRATQLESSKASAEIELKQAKHALSATERSYKKMDHDLKGKLKTLEKVKEKLAEAKRSHQVVGRDDTLMLQWVRRHNMEFIRPSTSSSDQDVILKWIDLEDPHEKYFVLFNSIVPTTGHFSVKNVIPDFDEAPSVIERANNSMNFRQFLIECKQYWQRRRLSPGKTVLNQSIDSNANSSRELFESPTSDS